MHFFRSKNIYGTGCFDAEKEGGIISLSDLVKLTSIDHFRKRLEPDYISHYWGIGVYEKAARDRKTDPYWSPSRMWSITRLQ